MAEETIAYDPNEEGWVTFWSFSPDMMIGLNGSLYSWKNGDLYKHDTNTDMNTFYGVSYPSKITPIFNQDPISQKLFKAISLESNTPWAAVTTTDLNEGEIDEDYFVEKEGTWYAFIRRPLNQVSPESLSTQGIGNLDSIVSQTLSFAFDISQSPVDVGDILYLYDGSSLNIISSVVSYTQSSITVSSPMTNTPTPGQLIVIAKNSVAESFVQRGAYMKVELTNNEITPVELFSVSTEAEKSYP